MRTGGCQCGAVRFKVEGELGRPSLCHCRMCQKAFGGPYGALVSVKTTQLTWTRGTPSHFQSSNLVKRGFCSACGTPLTFEWSDKVTDLAIFAFDEPADIVPVVQMATDTAPAWAMDVGAIPHRSSEEQVVAAAHYAAVVSYQHPDHD